MADLVPQFVAPEGTDSPTKRIRADSIRSGTFRGQYNLTGSILVLKDNLNSASGFLAFGTSRATVPTSPTSGTGVYIDYTGIYGLSSGTQNFVLDANGGSITAISGTIGGWTISSVDLHNAGSTVKLRGAGNLAFGSTPPTSATVGTGIFIDSTGIYGLNSNTQQFFLQSSDGKAYAGAGAVTLDSTGIIITANNQNTVRWASGNDSYVGVLRADSTAGQSSFVILANGNAEVDTGTMYLIAQDTSSDGVQLLMEKTVGFTGYASFEKRGSGGTFSGLMVNIVGAGVPANANLHIRNTAVTFLMEDTTASAKSLKVTTDANLAKFEEYGGAAANLLVLDLANNRAAFGTATTVSGYKLVVSGGFRVAQASGEVFTTVYTGASGSGSGNVFTVYTDDGAALASGDRLATFYYGGADDASHTLVAGIAIIGKATEAWDSTHHGSRFDFVITPNAGSGTTAMTLDQDSTLQLESNLALKDGITAPGTLSGYARIYVDTSDGDLKVKFGDGTVKTLATDT